MKTTLVNDYHVAGNEFIAIAININDPKDAHYFTPCKVGLNHAYEQAMVWTSLGIDTDGLDKHV